jgi:hypothetical protein
MIPAGLINRGNIIPLMSVATLTSYGAISLLEKVVTPGLTWTYVLAVGVTTWAWMHLYDYIFKDIIHTSIRGTLQYLINEGKIKESDVDLEDE